MCLLKAPRPFVSENFIYRHQCLDRPIGVGKVAGMQGICLTGLSNLPCRWPDRFSRMLMGPTMAKSPEPLAEQVSRSPSCRPWWDRWPISRDLYTLSLKISGSIGLPSNMVSSGQIFMFISRLKSYLQVLLTVVIEGIRDKESCKSLGELNKTWPRRFCAYRHCVTLSAASLLQKRPAVVKHSVSGVRKRFRDLQSRFLNGWKEEEHHAPKNSNQTTKPQQFINISKVARRQTAMSGQHRCYIRAHTTAGVTINENADPDVVRDMLSALDKRILHGGYLHCEGNSHAHIKASSWGLPAP